MAEQREGVEGVLRGQTNGFYHQVAHASILTLIRHSRIRRDRQFACRVVSAVAGLGKVGPSCTQDQQVKQRIRAYTMVGYVKDAQVKNPLKNLNIFKCVLGILTAFHALSSIFALFTRAACS